MNRIKTVFTLLITLCCSLPAVAQLVNTPPRISLITVAPGSEIYSLEGHTGLRIVDDRGDVVANWGLFDFDAPGFVYRFVKGETDYQVGLIPTDAVLEAYRAEGRRVTETVLDLTPEEAVRVRELVAENLAPENRVYRYNYIEDNCATRPLNILRKAVDGVVSLAKPFPDDEAGFTYRSVMRYFHRNYPWYQFGIDLALGSGIDGRLHNNLYAFAPVALERMVAGAVLTRADGSEVPLAGPTNVLVDFPEDNAVKPATPFWLSPLFVFAILALVAFFITLRDLRRRRLTAWFDFVFYLALGLTGLVLSFLIFVSVHEATSPNWLYLWINPLCLAIAFLAWKKPGRNAAVILQMVNGLLMYVYIFIILAGIQDFNPAFILILAADFMRQSARVIISLSKSRQ